jgi:hypothetical protein
MSTINNKGSKSPSVTPDYGSVPAEVMHSISSTSSPPPPYETVISPGLQSPPSRNPIYAHQPNHKPLSKPIAIPAVNKKFAAPFLRAYPPVLAHHGISEADFLPLLDKLNQVIAASPPLQVLGLAAGVVGFVPLATAQIVSASVQAASTFATVALSKGRTELYLRELNRDVFEPRGLKVELVRLDALAKLAGMPVLDGRGKVGRKAYVLGPVEDLEEAETVSSQERRLKVLEPWVQPLKVEELPTVGQAGNLLDRIASRQQAKKHDKGERKMLEERTKVHEEYHEEMGKVEREYSRDLRKLEDKRVKYEAKNAVKPSKDTEKKLREVEKERRKVVKEYEKEKRKIEDDRLSHDKEEEALKKALFLVIRNEDAWRRVEMGSSIDGPT